MRNLKTNSVGKTDIKLPSLGFGAAVIGGLFEKVSSKTAQETLASAIKNGLNYVDTAPYYGIGRSERLVGDALRNNNYIISTKVGRILKPGMQQNADKAFWPDALPFHPLYDYSYDGIMRSFEDSQQRLGLDKIDILYVHDIAEETHGSELPVYFKQLRDSGMKALNELKKSGNIKAIGIGVNEVKACQNALEIGQWDIFLLAGRYTLLEQSPLDDLFDQCIRTDTSIVIGGPFNSGILVGGSTWNYNTAPQNIIQRVDKLQKVSAKFNIPLAAAALQFPLAHQVVSSVIPGLRSIEELNATLKWIQTDIPIEYWQALKDSDLLHPNAPTPRSNPFYEL